MVVMLIFISCSQKKTETTVLSWGTPYTNTPEFLNGNLKEVTQNSFWAVMKDGKVEKGALLTKKDNRDSGMMAGFHALFNDSGKLIRCDLYGDNQKVDWSIVNDFNNGRVEKENWIRNDTVFSNALFRYNDKGLIDSIRNINPLTDTTKSILVFTTDEKGNYVRMDAFDSKGRPTFYGLATVDAGGRVTKLSFYQAKNDSLQQQQEYTYNEKGFCESYKSFDKNDKLIITLTGEYAYDDKGNWVKTVWSKNGKVWEIDERSYIYF